MAAALEATDGFDCCLETSASASDDEEWLLLMAEATRSLAPRTSPISFCNCSIILLEGAGYAADFIGC